VLLTVEENPVKNDSPFRSFLAENSETNFTMAFPYPRLTNNKRIMMKE